MNSELVVLFLLMVMPMNVDVDRSSKRLVQMRLGEFYGEGSASERWRELVLLALHKYQSTRVALQGGLQIELTFGYIISDPMLRWGVQVSRTRGTDCGIVMLVASSPAVLDRKLDLLGLPVTFSLTLASNEIRLPSRSPLVLRFFLADESDRSESGGRFLHERCLVPGRLSGPLRFGTVSYSHSLLRRVQLLQTGLVESQRILRARLEYQQIQVH